MKGLIRVWATAGILVLMANSARAVVVTNFATADARIGGSLTQANINWGGADQMLVGNHTSLGNLHGLLRFDLSSLPSDVVINSVTLIMHKPSVGTGAAFTVNVFELSAANANWVEGTANGVAQSGSATWDSKGPSAWAGSGGASTAGTDYINTPLASYSGSTAAGSANFTSQAAFISAVSNSWGGVLNLGVGLNSGVSGSYYRFATIEHATLDAPALIIDYTVAPSKISLILIH